MRTIIRKKLEMSKFYPLQVDEVTRETDDCVSVSFDIPTQFKNEFSFIPGQYLVLETSIQGEKVRRSYSLCSSPNEDQWRVAIKKVPDGKFSTYANEELKKGDTIDVMPPDGNFKLETSKNNANTYVAYAAGSGITPVLSMIKTVMDDEPDSKFMLFYGNRTTESIIFRNEIENLKNIYMDRMTVHHILSKEKLGSPLFFGRIDSEKAKKFGEVFYTPNDVKGYYICGPSAMIFSIKETLESQGVSSDNIHFELFYTDDIPKVQKVEEVTFDPKIESQISIVLDGESFDMPLEYGGKTILDAALDAGADLPFACKGGVCSTCKAKITSGEVEMDLNYALEPDEVKNGFVLTCQAHPRSSSVTVNFDEA